MGTQVSGIAQEIERTSEEGRSMALTVDNLGTNLAGFVGLAEKGSQLSNKIMESSTQQKIKRIGRYRT